MTGQFFFNLLNPAIALILAITFIFLYAIRPKRSHLLLLGTAFLCSAIAFTAQDFFQAYESPFLRILTNGLFLLAVLCACCAALVRVHARIPGLPFAIVLGFCGVGFSWFIFVDPSVVGRIYVVNATFAFLGILTALPLMAAGPKKILDWFFLALVGLLLVAALIRPMAMLLNSLDINAGSNLVDSAYWATVQALTPVLSIAIALVFLIALALEMMNELKSEAERDFLTGLLNRRGFDLKASAALGEKAPSVWQSAVMLADIDDFKKINDTFGHSVGDEVIAAVSTVLAAKGNADLVGRMGGEEFALFYSDVRRGELLDAAEAIRLGLSRILVQNLPKDYPLTLSIGIHTRHQSETLSRMMASADQALYTAKMTGKDRAVLAPIPLRSVIDQPQVMLL